MKIKILYLSVLIIVAVLAALLWAVSDTDRSGDIVDPPQPKPAWKTRPMYRGLFQ